MNVTVSAIAGSANLNRSFNLDVVARYLPLTENTTGCSGPIGIKYGSDIRRGKLKKIKKKRLQKNNRRNTGFINQCTIIVRLNSGDLINVKLFNTGELVLTGAKRPEHNDEAVEILVSVLSKEISGLVPFRIMTKIEEKFKRDRDLKSYVSKYQKVLNRINDLTDITDISNISDIRPENFMRLVSAHNLLRTYLSDEQIEERGDELTFALTQILTDSSHYCWITHLNKHFNLIKMLNDEWFHLDVDLERLYREPSVAAEKDHYRVMWLISKIYDLLDYFGCEYIIRYQLSKTKSEARTVLSRMVKQSPFFIEPQNEIEIVLPHCLNAYDLCGSPVMATCWNCSSNVGYMINRALLNQILNQKYLDKVFRSSIFRPDQHPAVNIKYISSILCQEVTHKIKASKKGVQIGCNCCDVTMLIFRTGDVIITGATSLNHITDMIQKIQPILERHSGEIRLDVEIDNCLDTSLPVIEKCGEKIYLLRSHILHHPRNYLLLGQLGMRNVSEYYEDTSST